MIPSRQALHNSCFLLSIISALFLSCGDSINITGITETAVTGDQIGNVDEDDWCTNPQDGWALHPAFANPTTNGTTLLFEIPQSIRVKLQILNKDKKVVRLLVDRRKAAGQHSRVWDLSDEQGNRVRNGFYRAQFFIDDEFKCQGDIQVISNN